MRGFLAAAAAMMLMGSMGVATAAENMTRIQTAQRGGGCKAAITCQEAVEMWCGGYSRADADDDGIPCENVCRSRTQVEAIKKNIGC